MPSRLSFVPLASVILVALVACGDDAESEPGGGSSGVFGTDSGPPSSSGNSVTDSGAPEENPCPTGFKTTGLHVGTVVESRARAGGSAWSDTNNAFEKDGTFAKATLADGANETEQLVVSGFGFSVPSTAATWGIEVEFTRHAPEGGIVEGRIEALVPNKTGRWKFIGNGSGDPANWPSKNVGTHHYGQQVDTWGYDLYPGDVNDPKFAIAVYAARAPGKTGTVTALVDQVMVAIHYCEK